MKDALLLKEEAQIVGCELAQVADITKHSEDPYEEMALRLVYHALNGPVSRRIEAGIRHAKQAGADGVVWFNHWDASIPLEVPESPRNALRKQGSHC